MAPFTSLYLMNPVQQTVCYPSLNISSGTAFISILTLSAISPPPQSSWYAYLRPIPGWRISPDVALKGFLDRHLLMNASSLCSQWDHLLLTLWNSTALQKNQARSHIYGELVQLGLWSPWRPDCCDSHKTPWRGFVTGEITKTVTTVLCFLDRIGCPTLIRTHCENASDSPMITWRFRSIVQPSGF